MIRAAAPRQTWISTLAMHERDGDERALAIATDNLARFAADQGDLFDAAEESIACFCGD